MLPFGFGFIESFRRGNMKHLRFQEKSNPYTTDIKHQNIKIFRISSTERSQIHRTQIEYEQNESRLSFIQISRGLLNSFQAKKKADIRDLDRVGFKLTIGRLEGSGQKK